MRHFGTLLLLASLLLSSSACERAGSIAQPRNEVARAGATVESESAHTAVATDAPTAAPKAGEASSFTSMTALSDGSVWAAGLYTQGGVDWPFLDHWDGTVWDVLAAPKAGDAKSMPLTLTPSGEIAPAAK